MSGNVAIADPDFAVSVRVEVPEGVPLASVAGWPFVLLPLLAVVPAQPAKPINSNMIRAKLGFSGLLKF